MSRHIHTRRLFLQRSMAFLAATPTVPSFLHNAMMAIARPLDMPLVQQPSGTDGKILIVVQLSGGNDGLNTIIPHGDDLYRRERGDLALVGDRVLRIDDHIGMNSVLAPVKELFDNAQMSVIQGVGYPNPNRSHFRSMDIWHTAEPHREVAYTGWLGRFFDNTCEGEDPHAGIAIGDSSPLAMKGERVPTLAFERPDTYRYGGRDLEAYLRLNEPADPAASIAAVRQAAAANAARGNTRRPPRAADAAPTDQSAQSQLEFLTRTAMDAQVSSDRILRITRDHNPPGVNYPTNGFGQGLRNIAAMIKGGLPTRVYYISLGGFDTHANQAGNHDRLLTNFAQGTAAFWADLKQQRNDQRVLMMTFSEFGRRVRPNASAGTDHGAAAPMFLMGPAVTRGVVNNHPSLADLDQGDLKFSLDFRNVYATILEHWLETPSRPILGGQFQTLPIIKG